MDKGYLPYLHNEKKFQVLPNGQCLYRYPKGDGVKIVKVSKELRRELFELDKREYNDNHREYRRRGELPTYDDTSAWEYVADESTYTLEDSLCERMDREHILKDHPDEYSVIVKMAHEKYTQSEIAETIGKTQGYVSQVLAKISNVFEEDNINDGERTEAQQYAEKLWRQFQRTGKCEQYYDVFMDYLTAQLHREDLFFCLDWFYSEREFIHNISTRLSLVMIRKRKILNIITYPLLHRVGIIFNPDKQLEKEKGIKEKNNDFLFNELRKLEKKIPELERYKEYVDFIHTHAPDKLTEAKRTANERARAPKPPKHKNYQWTK